MKVIDISCTYKDSEETHQLFDSVSAAAVWFAHEVRRNLNLADRSMIDGQTQDTIAAQVGLLFAHYDEVTGNDPDVVNGGDPHCQYGLEVREVMVLKDGKLKGDEQ